ncbi:MAG: DUF7224 domain-containing protein [Streptomyces sp.]|uniref:DUF7224 domain-containing protein n=1 Tax=Streptomyces sp. TaxID=1931 RepID=UPI003D6B7BE6
MLIRTVLRCGPAGWVALFFIPALLVLAGVDVTDEHVWETAAAGATVQFGFVTTVCGGCAAWEGSRMRRGRVLGWAPVRSDVRLAWERLVPVLVLGLLAQTVVTARFTVHAWESPGHPNPGLIAVWLGALLAHTAVGYIVGYRLPQLTGVAVMLVGGFFWGFWPAALESPSWLRHLNGQGTGDCCTIDRELSVRSIAATLTFNLTAILGAVLLTMLRGRTGRRRLTAAVLATGTVASVILAVPLGFDGSQAREKDLDRCAGDAPAICLWPEQEPERAALRRQVGQTGARLAQVGVTLPRRLAFSDVRTERKWLLEETATSVLPEDVTPCADGDDTEGRREDAQTVLYIWLSLTAGTGSGTFSGRMPGDAVTLAEKAHRLPRSAQQDWYERNMRAVRHCGTTPRLDPATYASKNDGNRP